MRLIASLFALLSLCALGACGAGNRDASDAMLLEGEGAPSPLLYEITSDYGSVEGWLFGTIHALPDGVTWRNEAIERVSEQADHLLVEVAAMEDRQGIARTFTELATTPDLGPLPPRIDPELHAALADMIVRSETPLGDFNETETWAAAIMLAQVDAIGRPRNGVDRALIRDFNDRVVGGFETPGMQLGVFDALDEEDQRDLLEGTVREWMVSRDNPGWLTRAWLRGDLETIENATSQGIMADPELREALLVQRNRDWMGTLLAALQSSRRPLIAVGTAHIVGPDGLPALLEAEGYSVRRIQ